ncbi:MAG TPA: DedA family protein [Mycobacteriales bacterium]|jgi:membrane protein DedA with SNARE-associated domain|nr:DedA family protein [Mycobacteriales bacterium]
MLNSITDAISGSWWTYPLILVICAGDAVLPILPSETAVVTGGVLSAGRGLSLPMVMLMGALGAFIGDSISYAVGRWAGPWARRRLFHGPRGRKTLEWAERQLAERGGEIIVVARFVPGGRTATTFISGATSFPYRRFAGATAIGAVIWSVYNAMIGRIGGAAFEDNTTLALLVAFGVAVCGMGIIEFTRYRLRVRARARKATASERAAGEAPESAPGDGEVAERPPLEPRPGGQR